MLTSKQEKAKRAALAFFGGNPTGSVFAAGPSATAGSAMSGNLVGVGVGARSTAATGVTADDVVRIYVTAQTPQMNIPARFGDLPTDVVAVGDVLASALLATGQRFGRHRPASCGVSVGHSRVTAGTLGCRVSQAGLACILSNNHVLADCNGATLGDAILQPGFGDGGRLPNDDIASLHDFEALDFSGAANDFDAAIAKLNNATDVESDIIDIGTPGQTPMTAQLYQSVRKHGRTTGHTVGVVVDVSVSLWVGYGLQKAWFQDQLAVQGVGASHFSAGGDSGSLIVDAVTLDPVALLFAGSTSGLTFGNPIGPVLQRFGMTIN